MVLRDLDMAAHLVPPRPPRFGRTGHPSHIHTTTLAGHRGGGYATLAPDAPITRPRPDGPAAAPAVLPRMRGWLSLETRRGRMFNSTLEIAPGLITWLVVSSPLWAGLLLPRSFAIAVLLFDLFWLYVSATTAWRAVVGYRRLRTDERADWGMLLRRAEVEGRAFARSDEVFHIVIIPNYKEPAAIVRRTLASLAAQENARQIVVVLALEAREQGGGGRARLLEDEFREQFAGIFSTFHPAGIPGEVAGKSSNENWAARIAKRRLVDELGHDPRNLTISSCDADTVFHPRYFACLTYKFATDPHRHRRFWQSPILLTNNIWQTPAPLRIGSALAGVHILSNLVKRDRVVFPQSTYTLSLQMAMDVDYWDPDIIPEDWHMFLKCYYTFSGAVEVEPIFLPTGNDAVSAGEAWASYRETYEQHKRHAWGASDIPYAVRMALAHGEMPAWRRARRLIALVANHLLWTSHWFMLAFAFWAPRILEWTTGRDLGSGSLFFAAGVLLKLCLVPYVVMILVDAKLRPPKPARWNRIDQIAATLMWAAIPVTSLLFGTLPALVSQTRLMLGKRLEYRVTPKA